jgi:aminoglycoside phosphotransferase (APT) family kinase protein
MTICRVYPYPATRSGGSEEDFSSLETREHGKETAEAAWMKAALPAFQCWGISQSTVPVASTAGTPLDFAQSLQRFLVQATGDPAATIDELRRHTEGFSLETVSFTASWKEDGARTSRRLVLRRQPAAGLLEPYDLAPQVTAMRAVEGALAVPRIRWFEQDAAVLGAPFYVMDFVDGDVPLPVASKDGTPCIADPAEREALARDLCANLARLHRFDWKPTPLAGFETPDGPRDAARRQLDVWRGYYERSRPDPSPMLARAFRELERRLPALPEKGPVAVVHGDFRTGNFLREGAIVRAVLDWEMVHLGDPLEDLAWAASRLWRGQTKLAGVLVPCDLFYRMYEEAGGHPVDRERLRFYDLLAGVKMAAIMLTGLRAYADRRTDDTRMAIFRHQLAGMNLVIAESLGLVPALDA